MRKDWIAILDFGSQYTHLIARRIREYKVYSEIVAHDISAVHLARRAPTAIILSGGPASVTAKNAPLCDVDIFALNIPILGICYGAQLMAKVLGGSVAKAKAREYGKATLSVKSKATLFKGLNAKETVWMSHGDRITRMPQGFHIIGSSGNSPIAAMENEKYHFYGVQFHPEVLHTPKGKTIVQNFLTSARCRPTWNMRSFIKESVRDVRSRIGKERVLCALSGGVDSSVLTMLLHKAIGKNLIAIFIDNGVLRKDEAAIVKERFKKQFKGIRDPERKRKVIGRTFIEVFEREAKKLGTMPFLAQGTLYPDVIESSSAFGGPSATIKTHHNVGGLPKNLKFTLIEPLRYLFKDEVRMLGKELGLPDELVYRHPFPGPGLAVRIIGPITEARLDLLRKADWILINEIKRAKVYRKLWQSFCVLLPIKTVGVMGDERTYENVIAVRAVTSEDAMTAHWAKLPYELLETVSNRIINEVKGINRVVYDISSKPPSTIEWE
jgi:GMP synthase (glutamine-hydrolysing)